jgi:hypothetical protein
LERQIAPRLSLYEVCDPQQQQLLCNRASQRALHAVAELRSASALRAGSRAAYRLPVLSSFVRTYIRGVMYSKVLKKNTGNEGVLIIIRKKTFEKK